MSTGIPLMDKGRLKATLRDPKLQNLAKYSTSAGTSYKY